MWYFPKEGISRSQETWISMCLDFGSWNTRFTSEFFHWVIWNVKFSKSWIFSRLLSSRHKAFKFRS